MTGRTAADILFGPYTLMMPIYAKSVYSCWTLNDITLITLSAGKLTRL